jgi:hypothetical protein
MAFQLRNVGGLGSGKAILVGKMTRFYTVDKSRPCCHRDGNRFLGSGLYGQSVEQARLRLCTGLWQYHWSIQRGLFIQVSEYLVDDHRIFDTGNNLYRTTAIAADLYVNIENSLQPLCPIHPLILFRTDGDPKQCASPSGTDTITSG